MVCDTPSGHMRVNCHQGTFNNEEVKTGTINLDRRTYRTHMGNSYILMINTVDKVMFTYRWTYTWGAVHRGPAPGGGSSRSG